MTKNSDTGKTKRYRSRQGYNGTRLIRLINARASESGLTMREVSAALGMHYSFFLRMCNDPSMPATLSKDYVRSIARFLGLNVVAIYQYAGIIDAEDYAVETTTDEYLEHIRREIEQDSEFAQYAPNADLWRDMPLQARMLIASMYARVRVHITEEVLARFKSNSEADSKELTPPPAEKKRRSAATKDMGNKVSPKKKTPARERGTGSGGAA